MAGVAFPVLAILLTEGSLTPMGLTTLLHRHPPSLCPLPAVAASSRVSPASRFPRRAHHTAINEVLAENDEDVVLSWAMGFLGLAFYNLAAHWFRGGFVFLAGERLTYRIRHDLFVRILHQPAAWFDDKEHSKSQISQRLGNDCGRGRDLVGDGISLFVLIGTTLFGGILVAFVFCWRTALVVLALVPFMGLGGIVYQKVALSTGEEDAKACTWGCREVAHGGR